MKQFKFNERQRFSIRKFSIGAASVLLGSVFFAVSSVEDVQAAEQSQNVVSVNENKQTPNPVIPSNSSTTGVSTKEANTLVSDANVENKPEGDVVGSSKETQESVSVVSTISDSNERKLALSKLIEEIDGKFTNGKYASKTEESVNQLKATLEEAKSVLSNATTESELTQAHSKLVTATTKLQTKPTEKKQAPAVDTTNGKATVGKKATNTEKASESNSIANSGSRDERHGKALDRSNPFRTDGATTDTDPSANQTYTLPGDSASVTELANSLKGLDSSISNETKLASIDEVGALKNVQAGEVKEIDEFGGWSAVSADGKKGKFAIARKTNEGVFPIETVNVTRAGYTYTAHVEENSFDRSHEYALFLSKVRTNATKSEETFDGQPFKDVGEGRQIAKGLKGFNGIEKTYKAYSSSTGTGVNISFKTGFTGDIDGFKAGYKVEVIAKFEDGHTQSIYNQSFRPDQSINDTNKQVTSVDANDSSKFTVGRPPEPTTDALNQKLAGYKNRQGNRTGSFTSKNIDLPKGAVEYTVRISASDNSRLGMGYQTTWSQYALPVSGLGFTITQDTNRVARTLLQRVYDKLKETEERDTKGKTEATINAYKTQLENVKNLLAGDLKKTQDYKDIVTAVLADQQALRTDKSKLTASNNKLLDLINENPDPRIGKTPSSITPYDSAKTEATNAQTEAQTILNQENPDPDVVAAAVSKLNEKLAELKAARAELVVAATEAQKTKLQNDSNALTEADKTNKTPNSITEYNAKYKKLEAALTAAKNQAKAVLDKAENAGKVEATDAQIEVDKIKAELDKAAALLKEKGNTAELEKAKNDLSSYITQQTNANVTDGKTKDSQDAYAVAKNQADQAITDAATVINSENSTVEDVANALADIKAKKAALEAAKQNLVPAATEAQKEKLENTVAKLVKASTDGKTQDSVNAYETAYTNLTAELEAAKAKATAVKTAGDNASRLEALAAQEAVDAVLEKLEATKATLVDKATDDQVAELRKAEAALTPIAENTLTGVKTPNSIEAYNQAVAAIQADLTQAKAKAAELVEKAKANNATKADATLALAKVEELKAKLAEAKGLLKDKANTGDLAAAKEELKALAGVANVTDGKTTSTTEAYNAAKQAADAAVTAAEGIINNADSTPEQVAEALTNVKAKKAELEKAKAALVDKATEAQKAKLEADAAKLEKADTAGKTQDSINAYETAYTNLTTELEAAKAKAAAVKAAGDNASEYAALKAQEAVDAVQAKLEAAKAVLVDKATDDQVAELRKAEAALTPVEASTFETTKTPASIAAYKNAVDAIQTQLTEAKAKAADLVTKAGQNNATKAEAAAAIAKVDALKVELAKANALLKDKANTGDLAAAKEELKALAGEENVTDGKTTSTATAYAAAKQAADAAVAKAEELIANLNATPEEVAEALTEVKAKKAELEKAKAALVDKATEAQKAKLEADVAKLTKADTTGKTQDSINAYETTYTNLTAELEEAKAKAAAVKAAGDNASRLEALAAQEAVDAVLEKLEATKATLVDKATDDQVAELRKAEAALTPAEASTFETTKTPASIAEYKKAVEAIQADLTQAKTTASDLVTKAGQNNATKAEAAVAIAKVEALKAKLVDATALLKDKANTGDLATAKDELKALAKAENVTDGKTTSTTEAYNAVKQAADAAVTAAEGIINNADSTPEEVATALTNVKAKKAELEKAKAALLDKITQDQKDDLANAEENLKLADTTGKTKDSIKAYNDEVAKLSDELKAAKQAAKDLLAKGDSAGELEAYRVQAQINKLKSKLSEAAKLLKDIDKSAAKKEVEDAAKNAVDAIVANNDLTPEQKAAAKAKVAEEATKAITAIDKATTEDGVTSAKNVGKFAIEKEAAKAEIEAAKSAKEKAINANDKLSDDEKRAANEATAKAAIDAVNAIIAAADQTAVDNAKNAGTTAVTAVNPVGKDKALDVIQKATEAKLAEIDKNEKLSDKEKDKAKAKVAKAAIDTVNAIIAAADQTAVDNAKNAGTTAVTAVNPVGKDKALDVIQKATEAKLAEIDKNEKLSDNEKAKAKAKVAKAAIDAVNAIIAAADQTAVDSAQTTGTTAVAAVNPVGKDKALAEIDKALAAKEKEIDANDKLSDAEKSKAKEEAKKVAEAAKKAINAATDQAAVDAKQTEGTKAVSEVNPVGKDKAKAEIEATQVAKEKAIDANPDLTDAEKTAAKAKIAEEARKAIDAIDKAKTTEEVASAKESGKLAIEKEAEKAEIEAAKAAKEKAIDARTDLTDDEKAKAKAKVAEEAKKAIEAIEKAKTHDDVSAKTETGKDDIKKINPIGGKETAKKAIDEALAAKEKAIDARTDLLPEEKEAAKKAVREEAEAAKNAIDKATTSDDIKKVLDNGLDKIAKVNPLGAKEEAKKSIEERLADKEKEIDARTDLTPEEKAKAKALAREEAKAAKDAIDKATSIEAIEKALRPFLYQIDQDTLVFDRPALDIKATLQASVTGVVTVERGKVISQADIISKLNLPETVTVMNIDLPDTTTLGRKFAKVTLRLPGGKETTVNVPVEVTPQKNKDVIPSYNGGNDGNSGNNAANNTDAKVNKAKLEGAIHQLDELIIKESAKLDAETAKEANDLLADAKKVFANADASQAEVDAMVKRIEDFMAEVAPATNHATPANDQATQTPAVAPATTQAATNASQEAAANARKAAKELPNTGTADSTVAMVAAAASALLGLGLAGRSRKEDEEA